MATRYTQPQGGPFEVEWGNPLTEGLIFAAEGGQTIDAAGRLQQSALGAGVTLGTGPYGKQWNSTGSQAYYANSFITPGKGAFMGLLGASQATWDITVYISAAMLGGANVLFDQFLNNQRWLLQQFGAGLVWVVAQNGVGTRNRTDPNGTVFPSAGWYRITGSWTGGTTSFMIVNGVYFSTSVGGSPAIIDTITSGDTLNLGSQVNGAFSAGRIWNRGLSIEQAFKVNANPYQLYKGPRRVLRASGGSTDTPVNPGVGSIALTGYAPTLAQTANQAIAPGAGSTSITGYAPTIAQPIAVAPAAGALALTGYAPTLAQTANQALTAGTGTVALTGYAPTVSRTASAAVTPGVGSIAIFGYAPSVSQSAAGTVHPGVGAIAITGYAPTISQPIAVAPGAGAIALTGYSPSVTQPHAVAAGVGSLVLTGYAPTTAQTASQSIAPAVGSVALTGYAPSVTQAVASQILIPGVGTLAITGYPPLVAQAAAIEFGSPLIVTPTPRNWISSSEPRNWIASNPPRNWIAKRDIT